MENKNISVFSMLVMTLRVCFIMVRMFVGSALLRIALHVIKAICLIIENGFLSLAGLAFSTFTFYAAFEKYGLTSLAVSTGLHTICAMTLLAAALIIMKDHKIKIFSEIATHQSNISQLVKIFLGWLFVLEFLVFLVVDFKLFTMPGIAIFVAVIMLFINYFKSGLKEGNEYNKQFEE
ncbi:hypothetical protein ACQ9ZH_20980 [Pseudomonas chlororaphis]